MTSLYDEVAALGANLSFIHLRSPLPEPIHPVVKIMPYLADRFLLKTPDGTTYEHRSPTQVIEHARHFLGSSDLGDMDYVDPPADHAFHVVEWRWECRRMTTMDLHVRLWHFLQHDAHERSRLVRLRWMAGERRSKAARKAAFTRSVNRYRIRP